MMKKKRMTEPGVGVSTVRFAVILTTVIAMTALAPNPNNAQEPEQSQDDTAPTVLITGANRGLGLEFARQFHAEGYLVIATARRPDAADDLNALGVRVEQLDVADAASVANLAARLGDAPLDLLINNAGIGSGSRTFETVDIDAVERIIQVNTIGPMRVTQALLGNLRQGRGRQIVNITSGLGSIERNTQGGAYGYRESKAALNMFTRSLAGELRDQGFICIALSPGWVQTDMGGPDARLTPEQSVSAMRTVIGSLAPDDSGKFFNQNGDEMPW